MPTYDFTDKAEYDLENIIDFTVANWGNIQAAQYIDALEKAAQMLAENPDMGLKRESLSSGVLSFPLGSHILYYIKTVHGVTIIRVLHASMDPVKHIK